jgi:doubled CXXCH motif protein/cytochrome c554/c'-like protein
MATTWIDCRAGRISLRLACTLCIALIVIVTVVVARLTQRGNDPPAVETASFALTPISTSPYLNTGPDARYVGSETCKSCHDDRHASFRRTGMGRSMAAVDPAKEPPGATYDHALSKRRYRIDRQDGRMWHRESLLAPGASEVTLAEHPMTYVVGSGRHSRTYLCEPDGFMVESPVTWYSLKQAWAMSPGYDRAAQRGFDREVGMECLICHAGRVETVDGALHRMKVIEAAIGCERCHGPGSLHAEYQRTRPAEPANDQDFTIVNPRRLPRELAESVCQQCHLRPTAAVLARGRGWTDFRPGLPLQDFIHTYLSEAESAQMTVVGHVEQLHLSKCYKGSPTLTCVTCHDPHGEPTEEKRVEYYRAACLTCHDAQHCKVSEARRRKESPDNDCAKCHMPRSPTEIPHLAFSHHRIGVHDTKPAPAAAISDALRPFLDLSRFPEVDRKRSLGLGYLEAANREKNPGRSSHYREQSRQLLHEVRNAGLLDPSVDVNLARIHFDRATDESCPPEVLPLAERALTLPGISTQERCMALYFRAEGLKSEGRFDEALAPVRELTRLRRHPADWLLVAECEKSLGHEEAWMEALERAARIDPRIWPAHKTLADYYQRLGQNEKAAWHRKRAVP